VANELNRFERFISQASSSAGGHDYVKEQKTARVNYRWQLDDAKLWTVEFLRSP